MRGVSMLGEKKDQDIQQYFAECAGNIRISVLGIREDYINHLGLTREPVNNDKSFIDFDRLEARRRDFESEFQSEANLK